jgi:hypothetical protein
MYKHRKMMYNGNITLLIPSTQGEHYMIETLLSLALKKTELVAGYYSVDGKRYRIDIPDYGKWKGWLFLKTGSDYHLNRKLLTRCPNGEYVRSSTNEHGQAILAAILADPYAAMKAYGDITGTCSVCGRKLECPVSVRFGIGPTCLNQLISRVS